MNNAIPQAEPFQGLADFERQGFCVIDMPLASQEVLDAFGNMPRDRHSLSRMRQIRLGQYMAYLDENEWVLALLPRRDYVQSARFIKLNEAGGVPRFREQLEVDPTPFVGHVLDNLPVDRSAMFQINVNQIRVVANAQFQGVTVPEGPHRDGHEFSVIAVVRRHNVHGGETQVIDPQTGDILLRQTLHENQAILIDDERFIHYASNIDVAEGESGYRDIWVIEINRWESRAYGRVHEREALSDGL